MPETVQIGDIVWAKMPSYPLWPAIVIYPVPQVTAPYIGDESQHFVKFYGPGTNLCSWIPDKHIVPNSPKLMRDGKNKKSKKLLSAIVELEEHLKSEGLIVETQDEETSKKRKYKKRKRNQAAAKVKNKKTKVSGNKEISDTDADIEDHNLYDNQKDTEMQEKESAFDALLVQNESELDKSHKIQGKVNEHPKVLINKDCFTRDDMEIAFDALLVQNENELDKSHKIQDKVSEHPKVLPNKDCITKDDTEIENQCVQQLESEQVIPMKECVTQDLGNKEINDTDVVIEDQNLFKNQVEIDKYHQMQEKEDAFDGLQMQEEKDAFDGLQMQNEHDLDKSHKEEDKVDEHPEVFPNKDCVMEDVMEIENESVQQLEMERVIPIKSASQKRVQLPLNRKIKKRSKKKIKKTKVSGNKDINDTNVVINDHNLYKNRKEIDKYDQMEEKESALDGLQMQNEPELDESYKIEDKVEHPQGLPNKDCVTENDMEIESQCIQEIEQAIPIKVCVTEKDSTSHEQSIDTALKILLSDEILLNEFWKNRSGKKQALEHFQKIIEVLKDEIEKEECLEIQECDMQLQYQEKEGNKDPNRHQTDKFDETQKMLIQQGKVIEHSEILTNEEKEDNEVLNKVQCVPEMRADEQPVLSTKDHIAEKKSSPSEQSTNEAVEPIIYSTEAVAGEFFETAIRNGQFTTSSQNEFHENVRIPVRPNDSDTLHFKSSQKVLNIMPCVLPPSTKPLGVHNETNKSEPSMFKRYLLSSGRPLKLGFIGNGFLKCVILRRLILNKFNITLWLDTSVEANKEPYNQHTSGAKTVKTFQALIENCDIIFSYWESSETVKFQLSQVLCSVSAEAFSNKGYVELSTLDVETAYTCGRAVTSKGGRFLEAALLGDKQDAENGDLVLLASGDQNLFDECILAFRAISKFRHYFGGDIGRGSTMKIAHSMVQSVALAGLSEVVALIQRSRFTKDEFTDILNFTPFQHGFWKEKAELLFKDGHIFGRPVDDQRKDFHFGRKLAIRLKQPTWTCSAAKYFFELNS